VVLVVLGALGGHTVEEVEVEVEVDTLHLLIILVVLAVLVAKVVFE
jgi:hypothetical protein